MILAPSALKAAGGQNVNKISSALARLNQGQIPILLNPILFYLTKMAKTQ